MASKNKQEITEQYWPLDSKEQLHWDEHIEAFLNAEVSMRRFHASLTVSRCILVMGLGMLVFTFAIPQLMPDWLFVFALLLSGGSFFLTLLLMPFARESRRHRHQVARFFYQNDLVIEFYPDEIWLRHRPSSQIIFKTDGPLHAYPFQ
ncbi:MULTISPECIES: hypothetical protein [unclassified Vibrio]|uniref:Uncharacterized protein n=1 Tax=Vibrio sp. HB236076 TaxID=3232307 RepID=A0AB39HET3_9VIBR|nr:hypothetical protein [Vibrio sp. HB161653]MDP5255361.1 hypothetical protein [Vibrio sp. HB161653]